MDKKNLWSFCFVIAYFSCNCIYNKCKWKIFLERIHTLPNGIADFLYTFYFYSSRSEHKTDADYKGNGEIQRKNDGLDADIINHDALFYSGSDSLLHKMADVKR